jgi:ectoine hydroxylase-related dioxygenase (phytanoyl-CoA dioxygenase family)
VLEGAGRVRSGAVELPRFDATAPSELIADAMLEHGAAIIEHLLPQDVCARLRYELQPWIDVTPAGADEFSGLSTRRTGALLARSVTSRELIAHPLVLATVDKVLWPRKTTFQLHLTQVITIGPGSPAQQLHRDQWCFDFFEFPDDVHVEVGTMFALDDFTEANGATRVALGSHREQVDLKNASSFDTVPAEMPAGSIVLYTGRTVHGGGANTTDAARVGINVDYALGWLRQEENQYLSVPIDVARELPEDIQRLMGYQQGAYALGYIDDSRDPIAVLRPTDHSRQSFSVDKPT